MKVTGLIKKVGEVQVVSDKFKKREIWVETDMYTTLNIQLSQDKADQFNLKEGQEAEFEINLRGRTWTGSDGVEKCFNTLDCWQWKLLSNNTQPQQQEEQPTQEADDNLPF